MGKIEWKLKEMGLERLPVAAAFPVDSGETLQ